MPTKPTKFPIVKLSLVAGTAISCMVAFMYWGAIHAGQCGENWLYRTQFGVFACETNDEAGGWQCFERYGTLKHYLGLEDVDCSKPIQSP